MPSAKPIYLFLSQKTYRGPGGVARNLIAGLQSLGAPLEAVSDSCTPELASTIRRSQGLVGCLQPIPGMQHLPRHTLMGPNLFVLPSDWQHTSLATWDNFVVPSQWVLDKYRPFPELRHAKVSIWSAGINTEEWPAVAKKPTEGEPLTCLLYFKNRSRQDLKVVQDMLTQRNIGVRALEYGSYDETQLKETCAWANMGVLLTDTESQGLAYMQMLSSDLPLFVFDKPWWTSETGKLKVPATSVPYFDARCGLKTPTADLALFDTFVAGVSEGKYSPRDYVLESHTLAKSAQKYWDLLAQASGVK